MAVTHLLYVSHTMVESLHQEEVRGKQCDLKDNKKLLITLLKVKSLFIKNLVQRSTELIVVL